MTEVSLYEIPFKGSLRHLTLYPRFPRMVHSNNRESSRLCRCERCRISRCDAIIFRSPLPRIPCAPPAVAAAARVEAGRLADALEDVEEALALQPQFAAALSNRGNIHRQMGDRKRCGSAP